MADTNHEVVTWQEDVTHDRVPDKIEVDIGLAKAVGENLKGNEETVRIFSGKTEDFFMQHYRLVDSNEVGYLYQYYDSEL